MNINYFNDIVKFEDLHFDNILLDNKSNKKILIYKILHKTFIAKKSLRSIKLLCSIKQMSLLDIMMKFNIQLYLALKNML